MAVVRCDVACSLLRITGSSTSHDHWKINSDYKTPNMERHFTTQKNVILFMLCSWMAVVTLVAVYCYLFWKTYTWRQELRLVGFIFHLVFLLSSAAVNIYMFKYLRKKHGLAAAQQRSIHLKHKTSKLVLLLAVIMIVTCLPSSLWRITAIICYGYELNCNLHTNSTYIFVRSCEK